MRKNEIAGGNMSFAVLHAARECDDFQFIREYTQNSIEANATAIVWTPHPVYKNKLSCIDNGDGMSPTELVKYINTHYRSGKAQASNQNFGIGAKISGLKNNDRIEFHSWHNGKGFGVTLIKNEKSVFVGLEERNGSVLYAVPAKMKPRWIKRHGTVVILHGKSEREDTLQPDFLKKARPGVSTGPRWIVGYLNSHYFDIPETVHVLQVYPDKGELYSREALGQKFYLDDKAKAKGTLRIEGAKIRWWLTEDKKASDDRKGFVAALHANELFYEPQHFCNRGRLMQDFGVSVGYNQVYIVIEPDMSGMTQTRTSLAVNGKAFIPWMDWGTEFKEHMPAAIVKHIEEKTTEESEQVARRMDEVFQKHAHRYQAKQFLKQVDGTPITNLQAAVTPVLTDGATIGAGGDGDGEGGNGEGSLPADLEMLRRIFGDKGVGKTRGKQVSHVELPKVQFITNKVKPQDCGYRAPGELEGRAARYSSSSHELVVNKDFQAFQDAITEWMDKTPTMPAKRNLIEKGVFDEVVRTAIDLILTTLSYKWDAETQESALSEVVLTGVMSQQLGLYEALDHRFKPLRRGVSQERRREAANA